MRFPPPTPTQTATATPSPTVALETEEGPPGILWFIPVPVLFGLLLGIFLYRRTGR